MKSTLQMEKNIVLQESLIKSCTSLQKWYWCCYGHHTVKIEIKKGDFRLCKAQTGPQWERQYINLCQPLLEMLQRFQAIPLFPRMWFWGTPVDTQRFVECVVDTGETKTLRKYKSLLKGWSSWSSKHSEAHEGTWLYHCRSLHVMTDPWCYSDQLALRGFTGDTLLIPKMVGWFPGYQSSKVIDGMNSKEFWWSFFPSKLVSFLYLNHRLNCILMTYHQWFGSICYPCIFSWTRKKCYIINEYPILIREKKYLPCILKDAKCQQDQEWCYPPKVHIFFFHLSFKYISKIKLNFSMCYFTLHKENSE